MPKKNIKNMFTAIAFAGALFFLTACSSGPAQTDDSFAFNPDDAVSAKPSVPKKIPKIPRKLPSVPSKNLQANVFGAFDDDDGLVPLPKVPRFSLEDEPKDEFDIAGLLKNIDEDLGFVNITAEDIERGWYSGMYGDKRVGTPDSWEWIDAGEDSKWISPTYEIDKEADDQAEK